VEQTQGIDSDHLAATRLSYAIGCLGRVLHKRMNDVLAEVGITTAEYTVLSTLRNRQDLTNAQIARRSLVSRQSAHQIMGALEKRGLVDAREGQPGARGHFVCLTPAGETTLNRADELTDALEDQVFGSMPASERRALVGHLMAWVNVVHSS